MRVEVRFEYIFEVGDRVEFDHNGPGQKRSGTIVGIVNRTYIIMPDKKLRNHNGTSIQGPYVLEEEKNLDLIEVL